MPLIDGCSVNVLTDSSVLNLWVRNLFCGFCASAKVNVCLGWCFTASSSPRSFMLRKGDKEKDQSCFNFRKNMFTETTTTTTKKQQKRKKQFNYIIIVNSTFHGPTRSRQHENETGGVSDRKEQQNINSALLSYNKGEKTNDFFIIFLSCIKLLTGIAGSG